MLPYGPASAQPASCHKAWKIKKVFYLYRNIFLLVFLTLVKIWPHFMTIYAPNHCCYGFFKLPLQMGETTFCCYVHVYMYCVNMLAVTMTTLNFHREKTAMLTGKLIIKLVIINLTFCSKKKLHFQCIIERQQEWSTSVFRTTNATAAHLHTYETDVTLE